MSFWRKLLSFFNIQVFLMKNVFQNKKQQVFLNQLEVFQNEKNNKSFWQWNPVFQSRSKQKKTKKKTGKVFQGIMSFRKTSSLSECINCQHHWYVSTTNKILDENNINICLSFFKFSNYPVFLEQVLDPMSLSSKPGIRFAQEHQEMRRLHFCATKKMIGFFFVNK